MSQLDQDLQRLWSGSGKQNIPNEWELHDMENFDLCIQLFANIMIDLIYDLRLKLKALKDHMFPVNLEICSDPEDLTKTQIFKWYVVLRYARKKKKTVCKHCTGPCLKNVFMILEALENDLFAWEKKLFRFSEERPDEDYKRVIKNQQKIWESKYSPLDKLKSLLSRPEMTPPKPRRSSSLNNLYYNYKTLPRHQLKEKNSESSSSKTATINTAKKETLQQNNNGSVSSLSSENFCKPKPIKIHRVKIEEDISKQSLVASPPDVQELSSTKESAIFLKPKFIGFSIDKILRIPYQKTDASSQVENQKKASDCVNPSKEVKYLKGVSNQENISTSGNPSKDVEFKKVPSKSVNPSLKVENQENTSEYVKSFTRSARSSIIVEQQDNPSKSANPSQEVANQESSSKYVNPTENVTYRKTSYHSQKITSKPVNSSQEVENQKNTTEHAKPFKRSAKRSILVANQDDASKSAYPSQGIKNQESTSDYENPLKKLATLSLAVANQEITSKSIKPSKQVTTNTNSAKPFINVAKQEDPFKSANSSKEVVEQEKAYESTKSSNEQIENIYSNAVAGPSNWKNHKDNNYSNPVAGPSNWKDLKDNNYSNAVAGPSNWKYHKDNNYSNPVASPSNWKDLKDNNYSNAVADPSNWKDQKDNNYPNPVAGPSYKDNFPAPKRSHSTSSLYSDCGPIVEKMVNDFHRKAYAYLNENGSQKMTNETYKYVLFFRMRMLSNKLINYIEYQPDLFDIFAEVQI